MHVPRPHVFVASLPGHATDRCFDDKLAAAHWRTPLASHLHAQLTPPAPAAAGGACHGTSVGLVQVQHAVLQQARQHPPGLLQGRLLRPEALPVPGPLAGLPQAGDHRLCDKPLVRLVWLGPAGGTTVQQKAGARCPFLVRWCAGSL